MGGMQGISLVELVRERVAMVVSAGHREEEKAPPPSLPPSTYLYPLLNEGMSCLDVVFSYLSVF